MNKKILISIIVVLFLAIPVFAFSVIDWINKEGNWLTGRAVSGDSGLVAYYKFDEGSGTIVADSSGNGNDGTIYGATWVDGTKGKALSFDGIDDYINIRDVSLTGTFSISWWYKTSNNGQLGVIIGEDSGNGVGGPKIGIVNNKIFVRIVSASDNSVSAPSFNEWHLITLTRDSNNKVDLYIDGGPANRLFSNSAQSGTYIVDKIGANGQDVTQKFNGAIDEVRIWNRMLSQEEIKQHYEEIQKPTCTDSDGSINYYEEGGCKRCIIGDLVGPCAAASDFCANLKELKECYCEDGEIKTIGYECPNGCEDGVCIFNSSGIEITAQEVRLPTANAYGIYAHSSGKLYLTHSVLIDGVQTLRLSYTTDIGKTNPSWTTVGTFPKYSIIGIYRFLVDASEEMLYGKYYGKNEMGITYTNGAVVNLTDFSVKNFTVLEKPSMILYPSGYGKTSIAEDSQGNIYIANYYQTANGYGEGIIAEGKNDLFHVLYNFSNATLVLELGLYTDIPHVHSLELQENEGRLYWAHDRGGGYIDLTTNTSVQITDLSLNKMISTNQYGSNKEIFTGSDTKTVAIYRYNFSGSLLNAYNLWTEATPPVTPVAVYGDKLFFTARPTGADTSTGGIGVLNLTSGSWYWIINASSTIGIQQFTQSGNYLYFWGKLESSTRKVWMIDMNAHLPHQFYGTVSYNNISISDRNVISAKINDIEHAGTYTLNGKYGYRPLFYVPADDIETIEKEGGNNNDKIDFYVNGIKVASYTFESGATTELNLVAKSDLQPCKNEVCETYESSLNCPEDCGEILKSEMFIENNICSMKVKNKSRVKIECTLEDTAKISKAKIKKQKDGNRGYVIVSNLELPGKTKTVYLDKIAGYGSVCVKDEDIEDIGEITLNCNGVNEFIVTCDGNSYNGYTCNDLNDIYEVSGLKHSGVIEYELQQEQTTDGNGGGDGECIPSWVCSDWSDCEDGIQRRTCEDKHDCNEPYKPKTIRRCEEVATPPPELPEEKNITTPPTEISPEEGVITPPVIEEEKHRNWLTIILVITAVSGIFGLAVYKKQKKSLRELESYIIDCLNRGYTKREVKNNLRSVGWPEKTINKFFKK